MFAALAAAALLSAQAAPDPNEEALRTIGATTYIIGLCERFIPPEKAREILASLSLHDDRQNPDRKTVLGVAGGMYLEGRLDPRRNQISAEVCADLLNMASEGMGAESISDRANREP